MKYLYLLFIIFLLSCSEEEPFYVRPEPTNSAILNPEIGGPNEQNQVYIDLSTQKTTNIQRDAWDLGFYSGNEFRIILNPSIYMAIKNLEVENIDLVAESDVIDFYTTVAVGTFNPTNVNYVDGFEGIISNTAINEISNTLEENKVYLLNLGYKVSTKPANIGSTEVSGEHRGWLKIRVLKNGENYFLQYANITENTHQEVEILKTDNYNFTFFSFNTNSILNIEPKKSEWDINFTVFMNEFLDFGTYGFTDFVLTNVRNNVESYEVIKEDNNDDGIIDNPFNEFTISDIEMSKFSLSQRVIGSNWRVSGGASSTPYVKDDRYYIIKDADGIYYKLKFLTMTNALGERGYPQFEYNILQ